MPLGNRLGYDDWANGYVRLHRGEQLEKWARIRGLFDPRGLLLDVGAGPGWSAGFFPDCQVVCVDPSAGLLGHAPGLKAIGKAEALPFARSVFDAVVSATALHHCDALRAWPEICRVSKPGAPVALSFFKRGKISAWLEILKKKGFQIHDLGLDWLVVGKNPV